MSDIERSEREKGLLATDDPEVWSEEFCRIFSGAVIVADEATTEKNKDVKLVSPGTMIGWFTNFAETVMRLRDERKVRLSAATEHVPETAREAFVEGVDDGRREDAT